MAFAAPPRLRLCDGGVIAVLTGAEYRSHVKSNEPTNTPGHSILNWGIYLLRSVYT
jgi:hypothetical protein